MESRTWASGSDESHGASDARTLARLHGELGRADLPRHLAFFYRSPQTQLKVASAFVKHGLETNNRCLYYLDTSTEERIRRGLSAAGVDVEDRLAAGDLLFQDASDVYDQADFEPHRLISVLDDASQESVVDGYDGFWVAGETTWCFHTDYDYDHVVEFEADFDATCPDIPIQALCQYDLNRFCETSVAKALCTHEKVIYRYTVCENPFYVPPSEYRSTDAEALNTRFVLDQFHDLAAATRQVDRREQRLSVVNRILRHNIRNELNVVRGIVDLVYEYEDLPDEHQERLATALHYVDEVFDIAEKARHVERTLDASSVQRTTLGPALDDARKRVAAIYPDAHVVVDGDTDRAVVADTTLATAFVELFLYAFQATESDPPSVTVTVTDRPPADVCIDIDYAGPPVQSNDRRVLEREAETQLEHCSTLGLWLVKWIVENGNGEVTFPDGGDPQIRVTLAGVAE